MKKLTTNEFNEKANKTHNYFYDYSLVNYIKSNQHIKIICPKHGVFEQTPNNHLSNKGCPKCIGMNKTTEEFISEAKLVHVDKYDYSKVNYINSYNKVKIICPIHGNFEQLPFNHLHNNGCVKCSGKNKPTNEEFIGKAKLIHGDKYDYSKVIYINNRSKIKIICEKHGVFEQTPDNHVHKNKGCPKCVGRNKTTEEFIINAKAIHNNYFDYSLVDYKTSHSKIKIICLKHGVFKQDPSAHLQGQGCPICKESMGERDIRNYLTNNSIYFIRNKRFSDCKDKKPLPFDFYLPSYNICIEFDGEQHYKPIKYWNGADGLLDRQNKDKIKTNYCNRNNIELLRIVKIKDIVKLLNIKLKCL